MCIKHGFAELNILNKCVENCKMDTWIGFLMWINEVLTLCSVRRFRGPPPNMGPQRQLDSDDPNVKRPAIIKDQDLREFDELLVKDVDDGGWAGAQGEIDYS